MIAEQGVARVVEIRCLKCCRRLIGLGRTPGGRAVPEQDLIYRNEAESYERLILREDHEGNLIRALQEIVSVRGKTVVDLGAGTGRFTRALAGSARRIIAIDISRHMLKVVSATQP